MCYLISSLFKSGFCVVSNFTILTISHSTEVIYILYDFNLAEEEYVSSHISYAELAKKHAIPLHILARYAKEMQWVQKRRAFRPVSAPLSPDISKLARSSDALEAIIENAFNSVYEASAQSGTTDTKTLKDLTATLKDAIAIKQNIFLLPVVTEHKQQELRMDKNTSAQSAESEIRVILENGADKFCV